MFFPPFLKIVENPLHFINSRRYQLLIIHFFIISIMLLSSLDLAKIFHLVRYIIKRMVKF